MDNSEPFLTEAEEIAQTEKLGLGDLIIAAVLGTAVFLFATLWSYPTLHPTLWGDAAVAAGVRPATSVVPGYWTFLASIVYSVSGIGAGNTMLALLGHLALALVAVCVFAVMREWLSFAMRMRPQLSRRRTFVMRLASVIGAIMFVATDPVWAAGQTFSETILLVFLTLGALEAFFVFLRKGEIKYSYLAAVLLGLIAAESPLGFFFAALFVWLTMFIAKVMPALESPFFRPEIMEVGKWHMTFLFLASLVAGIALNVITFLNHDGVEAVGETIGSVPLSYLLDYWGRIANAGDIGAWVLFVGIAIAPFVVTTIKFPSSADEEQFLSYGAGITFLVCGIMAFAQAGFLPSLWFWTYFPMTSQYLLAMGLFGSAATLSGAITILGVDSLCRNHARLSVQTFGEDVTADDDDDDETAAKFASEEAFNSRSTSFVRIACLVIVPVFLVAMMIPGRMKSGTREILSLVNAALEEIVDEAKGAKYLFSDGALDNAIELKASETGAPLNAISLMGHGSAMEVYLRTRGMTDKEDLFSFTRDGAQGLRLWMRDKPERLKDAAMMIGFDLWRRDGKPLPPIGGMLSRPAGFADEQTRLGGIEKAHQLAEHVLRMHSSGNVKECTEKSVTDALIAVQWRFARMAFYRGDSEDMKGNAETAIAEAKLSKELNDLNPVFTELLASMEKRSSSMMQQLTPREGLQLALVRADFTLGMRFAETILETEPDNPDANFAMGMFYLSEHQLSRAEIYLKRCLIRKPNEPVFYNNLAMIQIDLKKYEAAKKNVEKALKLLPGSTAVMDTKKRLEAILGKCKEEMKGK